MSCIPSLTCHLYRLRRADRQEGQIVGYPTVEDGLASWLPGSLELFDIPWRMKVVIRPKKYLYAGLEKVIWGVPGVGLSADGRSDDAVWFVGDSFFKSTQRARRLGSWLAPPGPQSAIRRRTSVYHVGCRNKSFSSHC